jgi:hypothetical protein
MAGLRPVIHVVELSGEWRPQAVQAPLSAMSL